MVRCRQTQHISKQPVKIKAKAAIQWLIENLKENLVAATLHFINKTNSFYKA
jgi:protein-arginine kinase activator protein McsA